MHSYAIKKKQITYQIPHVSILFSIKHSEFPVVINSNRLD